MGYLPKAAKAVNLSVNTDLASGIAIPIAAVFAALGVRRIRHVVSREHAAD